MSYELKAVPKPGVAEKVRPKGLKNRKPMKRYNAKRKGHMFPKHVDEARREWIRSLPCILADRACYAKGGIPLAHICVGRRQACHVKSRGSGGIDKGNMYPGCGAAHDQQHIIGIRAFNKLWGLDLKFMAEDYEQIYLETRGGSLAPTHPQEHRASTAD